MYKQECPVQVICSRDVEAIPILGKKRRSYISCLCTKQSNKLERISEHESSPVKVLRL